MASVIVKNNIPILNKAIIAALGESMEKVGQVAEIAMTARIDAGLSPPLKPATIEAKGSSTPLVDTGELYGAISHEVSSDGKSVQVGVFGSRANIMLIHEFGAPAAGIPERSVIRGAMNDSADRTAMNAEVIKKMREAIKKSALR